MPWLLALPAIVFLLAFHFVAQAEGAWYAFTDWNGSARRTGSGCATSARSASDVQRGALWNTLKLALGFVVVVNALGLALALGLNRTREDRAIVLRSLFFLPVVLSPLASAYIWQYIFDYSGALNQLLGAVGLDSWRAAVARRSRLGALDDPRRARLAVHRADDGDLPRRAAGDPRRARRGRAGRRRLGAGFASGASRCRCSRRRSRSSATLTLIFGLRVFDQVLALTGGGPVDATETLATQVYTQTFVNGRFGYGAALALVLTVLVAVIAVAQLAILRVARGADLSGPFPLHAPHASCASSR